MRNYWSKRSNIRILSCRDSYVKFSPRQMDQLNSQSFPWWEMKLEQVFQIFFFLVHVNSYPVVSEYEVFLIPKWRNWNVLNYAEVIWPDEQVKYKETQSSFTQIKEIFHLKMTSAQLSWFLWKFSLCWSFLTPLSLRPSGFLHMCDPGFPKVKEVW